MASTNQSPQFQKAQAKFLSAKTDEQRITALEEMIREAPKHKSAEKMLANLKTRYKKLKEKIEIQKKVKKSSGGKLGIKKHDMQAVIVGFTNSGKSSLLNLLTNTNQNVSPGEFSRFNTKSPAVGMVPYSGTNIQIIEIPAIGSEFYDRGIVHTADTLIILITNSSQLTEIEKQLANTNNKRLIVFNKIDLLSEEEKRKISATLKSKKYNFILISTKTREGTSELKDKLFQSFDKIRIYTKEPGKEKTEKPVILNPESTVKDVAEKILRGFSDKVKETKIWGPSSKFPGQVVGMQHKLKDMDIVEFRTK